MRFRALRVLSPPDSLVSSLSVSPSSYLIQKVDDSNYLIHRSLLESEVGDYNVSEIFQFGNLFYLACVAQCSSEEEAEATVHRYWDALQNPDSD